MSTLMLLITILCSIFIISWKWFYLHYFEKSKINFILHKKVFGTTYITIYRNIIMIVIISMYFACRWTPALINVINYDLINQPPSEFRSANLSILLMLDLCSFIGILLPLDMLLDKKKKITTSISLLSVLGGFATMFFTIPEMYNKNINASDFFIGNLSIGDGSHDEPLMFIMHFWMICIGLSNLCWVSKITIKDIVKTIVIILLYLGYILIISRALNIQTHVTALVKGDFNILNDDYYEGNDYNTLPSYIVFCEIFNTTNWELASTAAWISFTLIVFIIIGIKNTFWFFNHDKTIIINSQDNMVTKKDSD